MEIYDIIQRGRPVKIKDSAVTIEELDYNTTIETIMYMITIVEDDQEMIADAAGVLNSTILAELAFDIADVDVEDIPQDFFELAHKVVSVYETLQESY